jgi:hypothetical protein
MLFLLETNCVVGDLLAVVYVFSAMLDKRAVITCSFNAVLEEGSRGL